MTPFRFFALSAPLGLGILLPFLLARAASRPRSLGTGVRHCSIALGIVVLLFAVLAVGSGERFTGALYAALFVSAFAVLVFACYQFVASLVNLSVVAQLLCGLLVVAMYGLVFLGGIIVENALKVGLTSDALGTRLDLLLALSPYTVMADSIFEMRPLERRVLYRVSQIAEFPHHQAPWSEVAVAYLVAAYWLSVGSLAFHALRRSRG